MRATDDSKHGPRFRPKPLQNPPETPAKDERKIRIAQLLEEETVLFRRFIFSWLSECVRNDLSIKTQHDYLDKVLKFYWWWSDYSGFARGESHPNEVTTEHIKAYAGYLRSPTNRRWGLDNSKTGRERLTLSPASIEAYARAARVFFNWCEAKHYIEHNPFNRTVKFTRKAPRVIKRLQSDEVDQLFESLSRPDKLATFLGCRDLAVISLFLDSGIRIGELCGMKLGDLDLVNNRCQVDGKTGPRRAIFSEQCRTNLNKYLNQPSHPYKFQYRNRRWPSHLPLWVTEHGEELSYSGIESMVRRVSAESGIRFHPHQLRHSFGSTLAEQGTSLLDLKEMMGHTNITTTQIYISPSIEHLNKVHRIKSPLAQVKARLPGKKGRPRKGI